MTRSMLSCAVLVGAALVVSPACADPDKENFHARLSGFNDVGALNAETGAILSDGTATADVEFDKRSGTATYTLTFSGLSAAVTQAHIHFGKNHVPGSSAPNLGNGPAGTPTCPASGTVTGSWSAASVVAIPGQTSWPETSTPSRTRSTATLPTPTSIRQNSQWARSETRCGATTATTATEAR